MDVHDQLSWGWEWGWEYILPAAEKRSRDYQERRVVVNRPQTDISKREAIWSVAFKTICVMYATVLVYLS